MGNSEIMAAAASKIQAAARAQKARTKVAVNAQEVASKQEKAINVDNKEKAKVRETDQETMVETLKNTDGGASASASIAKMNPSDFEIFRQFLGKELSDDDKLGNMTPPENMTLLDYITDEELLNYYEKFSPQQSALPPPAFSQRPAAASAPETTILPAKRPFGCDQKSGGPPSAQKSAQKQALADACTGARKSSAAPLGTAEPSEKPQRVAHVQAVVTGEVLINSQVVVGHPPVKRPGGAPAEVKGEVLINSQVVVGHPLENRKVEAVVAAAIIPVLPGTAVDSTVAVGRPVC